MDLPLRPWLASLIVVSHPDILSSRVCGWGRSNLIWPHRDPGLSAEDRTEDIRRAGEACRLFRDAGLVVLTARIYPFPGDREQVRQLHPDGGFIASISAPYETPLDPELMINTSTTDLTAGVEWC